MPCERRPRASYSTKSLSQPSPALNRTDKYSSRPSEEHVQRYAARIQSGWRDRNNCTACRSATQMRTSGTAQALHSTSARQFRIVHNEKRFGWPPSAMAGARKYSPCAAPFRSPASQTSPRDPCIRAAGTSCLTQEPPACIFSPEVAPRQLKSLHRRLKSSAE